MAPDISINYPKHNNAFINMTTMKHKCDRLSACNWRKNTENKCSVFAKSKRWELGRGIQRFFLLSDALIHFHLSIFSSSSSPSLFCCSLSLLHICVCTVAFGSFRPTLNEKKKRTWDAHVNKKHTKQSDDHSSISTYVMVTMVTKHMDSHGHSAMHFEIASCHV